MKGLFVAICILIAGVFAYMQLGGQVAADSTGIKKPTVGIPNVDANSAAQSAKNAGDTAANGIEGFNETTWQIIAIIIAASLVFWVWVKYPALKYIALGTAIAGFLFVAFS